MSLSRYSSLALIILCTAASMPGRAQQTSDAVSAKQTPSPVYDLRAVRLLEEVAATLHRATTLRAQTRTLSYDGQHPATVYSIETDDVAYMRPNYLRIDVMAQQPSRSGIPAQQRRSQYACTCTPTRSMMVSTADTVTTATVFDGRTSECEARTHDAALHFFHQASYGRLLWPGEWDAQRLTDPLMRSVRYVGRDAWNGATYDIVEWVYEQAYEMPANTIVFTTRMFIDSVRHVRRVITTDSRGRRREDHQVLALTLDAPLTATAFVVTPSPGVTIQPGTRLQPPERPSHVGEVFPTRALRAPLLDGPPRSIADLLQGKRAGLLWLWDTGCSSCNHHFPFFEQLFREFQDKGIAVVALDYVYAGGDAGRMLQTKLWHRPFDSADVAARARQHRAYHQTTMPILLSTEVAAPLLTWETSAIVVDAAGRIVYQGIDLEAIRAAFYKLTESPPP